LQDIQLSDQMVKSSLADVLFLLDITTFRLNGRELSRGARDILSIKYLSDVIYCLLIRLSSLCYPVCSPHRRTQNNYRSSRTRISSDDVSSFDDFYHFSDWREILCDRHAIHLSCSRYHARYPWMQADTGIAERNHMADYVNARNAIWRY